MKSLSIISQLMLNLLGKDGNELKEAKKRRDVKNDIEINVEDILHRVQLHSVKANLQRVSLTEEQFIQLCRRVRKLVLQQPGLLRVDGPMHVATGTMGNYRQLSSIINRCGHPKFMNYVFLGDYSGKYDQSLECLVALFGYKLFAPYNFFLLRGCHQSMAMVRAGNLQEDLASYFGSSMPWLQVCETFCCLPYAAIIDEKVLCIHGGISPYLESLQQINQIPRPLDASDKELTCDLLWSDPTNLYKGWTQNDRGISVSFGSDVVASFLRNHDLSLICRGHEVPYTGFKFFSEKRMVTICSLSKYCDIMNNAAAVMMIDENSNCLFRQITDKLKYNGEEDEEGMTFLDMVMKRRKKEEEDEQRRLEALNPKVQPPKKFERRNRIRQ